MRKQMYDVVSVKETRRVEGRKAAEQAAREMRRDCPACGVSIHRVGE